MHAELKEDGVHVGCKRITRLMRLAGLQGASRRKKYRTTVRDRDARPAPDLVDRNFTVDHFPSSCLCGSSCCRGSVTGWKDLPAARKADYGDLVAPYLLAMDERSAQPSKAPQALPIPLGL